MLAARFALNHFFNTKNEDCILRAKVLRQEETKFARWVGVTETQSHCWVLGRPKWAHSSLVRADAYGVSAVLRPIFLDEWQSETQEYLESMSRLSEEVGMGVAKCR